MQRSINRLWVQLQVWLLPAKPVQGGSRFDATCPL